MFKKIIIISTMAVMSVAVWGCGAVKKEEPVVPTRYIEKADDAVDEYNENVEKLNETGNAVDSSDAANEATEE